MKKIIIVGSGRSVLNNKIGHKIDEFDIVVRFNGYQCGLGKYDEYVGTKTDIVFFNNSLTSKKYIEQYSNVYSINTKFIIKKASTKRKNHNLIKSILLQKYKQKNIIHYRKIFRSVSVNNHKVIIPTNIRNPTLGLMSIFYCLNTYKDYDIYICGFDRLYKKIKNKKYMSHYYENFNNLNVKHNMNTETNTIKRLIQYGIIKKYI